MHIIICPDSFKGSLTAADAARAIDLGASRACPGSMRELIPLADGGEGTVQAIIDAVGGEIVRVRVAGPLGQPVNADYGLIEDDTVAIIEMASAAGLHRVTESERNPCITSTYGVGELILHAFDRGCTSFIVGLGGSSTNDGGTGALSALGIRFLDRNGNDLPPGGAALQDLVEIDESELKIAPGTVDIRLACDVNNPLTGPNGASVVYGPQKGASQGTVQLLDRALTNYGRVVQDNTGIDVANIPGSGAAGGLSAGLLAFLGARIESGIDIVLDLANFDERILRADLIITGEGRVDGQTVNGKTVSGVLARAKAADVPVVVLAGSVGEGIEPLYAMGASAIFSISPGVISLEDCTRDANNLLAMSAENAVRLFDAGKQNCD